MKTAAVILAAGASSRLGRPKQDVVLGGITLLKRSVLVAQDAGLWPVFLVVRDPAAYAPLQSSFVRLVRNENATEGMSASLRLGAAAAMDLASGGLVVLTCDQPLLRPEHLQKLRQAPEEMTCSAYAGRRGVPAYFPASLFPELLLLHGDQGARGLLTAANTITDEDLALDVDTPEDLLRAEAAWAAREIQVPSGSSVRLDSEVP